MAYIDTVTAELEDLATWLARSSADGQQARLEVDRRIRARKEGSRTDADLHLLSLLRQRPKAYWAKELGVCRSAMARWEQRGVPRARRADVLELRVPANPDFTKTLSGFVAEDEAPHAWSRLLKLVVTSSLDGAAEWLGTPKNSVRRWVKAGRFPRALLPLLSDFEMPPSSGEALAALGTLGTSTVAAALEVDESTVRWWVNHGEVPVVPRKAIVRLVTKCN